jgi:hypothetical protein
MGIIPQQYFNKKGVFVTNKAGHFTPLCHFGSGIYFHKFRINCLLSGMFQTAN